MTKTFVFYFLITLNGETFYELESRPMPEDACVDLLAEEATYWRQYIEDLGDDSDRHGIKLACRPYKITA